MHPSWKPRLQRASVHMKPRGYTSLRSARAPALRAVEPLMTHVEATGERLRPEALRDHVARFDWRAVFLKSSCLASVMANDPGGIDGTSTRRLTIEPFRAYLTAGTPVSVKSLTS